MKLLKLLRKQSQLRLLILYGMQRKYATTNDFAFSRLLVHLSCFKQGALKVDGIVPRDAVGMCRQLADFDDLKIANQCEEAYSWSINDLCWCFIYVPAFRCNSRRPKARKKFRYRRTEECFGILLGSAMTDRFHWRA